MTSYPEYKEIGLPWLKNIPSHWSVIRNKNVLVEQKAIVGEKSNDFKLLSLTKQGVIYRDLENAKGKFPKEFNTYKIVEKDNLIFCLFDLDETPRTVGISSHSGMITGAYDVFKINNVNSHYVFYYYLSIDNIKGLKPLYSGLRKVVKMPVLLSTKLPIPPRIEQDQIVKYLDYKISKINKFIKSKKREIELLKELKQAEINSAVTKGLNPNVPMKDSGIDWLGEIPEHWAVRRLKYAANFNPALEIDINLQDDTIVSFMPMECLRTDYIEKREANYKDAKGYVPFQNGDVVMAKVTPCFENRNIAVALELVNEIGFGTSEIFVFRCIEILSNKFLMYFLQTEYFRNNAIASMTGTGGLKRVSPKVARNIQLPLPDISEQLEIVELLENKCYSIEKMVSAIINEINTIQEYKTSLISDVVTGKVDVRDVKIEDTFEMETLEEVEDEIEEVIEE